MNNEADDSHQSAAVIKFYSFKLAISGPTVNTYNSDIKKLTVLNLP